jgi:hypothetical protein
LYRGTIPTLLFGLRKLSLEKAIQSKQGRMALERRTRESPSAIGILL